MQYPLANENTSQFQISKTTHWKNKISLSGWKETSFLKKKNSSISATSARKKKNLLEKLVGLLYMGISKNPTEGITDMKLLQKKILLFSVVLRYQLSWKPVVVKSTTY